MDHYNKGAGTQNPYLSTEIQPLALHETDIDDLVALMAVGINRQQNRQHAAR